MTNTTTTPHVALVTGGNRGIGRATAEALARQGSGVIITYRSDPDGAEAVADGITQAGGTAAVLRLDARDVASFGAFAEDVKESLRTRFDRAALDVLVNNAGVGPVASIADVTEAQFAELFDTNVKGVLFLTQALLDVIANGGLIINLSSALSRFTAPARGPYAMTKGAIDVFTRHLAAELGPRGIRVNSFAPGAVVTDFAGGYLRSDEAQQQRLGELTLLGRVARPEDIGPAIAALTLPANAFITGERIEASGGLKL